MKIVSVDDFDYALISKAPTVTLPPGNHGGRKSVKYVNLLTAFDIETSRLPDIEQSIMYVWQWAIGPDLVVMGRTWEEFQSLVSAICSAAGGRTVVAWVHNLSYEFQFLAGIYPFASKDVFAVRPRKVLKATMEQIEFRCSYLHSNMSLAMFLQAMRVEHEKLEGYDYTKIRYPWTPLSDFEKTYCVADVVGLIEALAVEMEKDADSLWTIPLTSTGYVRRDAKHALQPIRNRMNELVPSYDLYLRLREAFRGGNTHASRYMVGYVVRGKIHSYDRSSSYPDVICNCKFPMSPFYHEGFITWEYYDKLVKAGRALLITVALTNIHLRDLYYPCPYISRDKCNKAQGVICDNGRVLEAEYIEISVTDIDWSIINRQYDAESAVIIDSYQARYGWLPSHFRQLNIDYYRRKTALKGSDDPDDDYYYGKSKNKLNSIYGLTAQATLRPSITYIDDLEESLKKINGGFVETEGTEEDYKKKVRGQWLPYSWSCWVTSWARYRLQEGIDLVYNTPGAEFLYCDTDSVKYTGEVDWSAYNAQRIADSVRSGAWADDRRGERHYMGVYELDGDYRRFRTWGAKKYAYVDGKGLHVTVSGVVKKWGARELAGAGGIAAFKPGFIFRLAGGTELKYNDVVDMTIEREGHELHITRNVVIRDSTYELSLTPEFANIIKYSSDNDFQLWL